jgi:hypothetical protein
MGEGLGHERLSDRRQAVLTESLGKTSAAADAEGGMDARSPHSATSERSIRLVVSACAAGAVLVLATLIGAYAVNVTAGVSGLSGGPEAVDAVAGVTKAVEVLGLACSIQLITTLSGRDLLGQREVSS